ncbi:MAG: cytochrome C [Pseudomonadota bacterium]
MKTPILLLTSLFLTTSVQADRLTDPGKAPPAYKAECASCHVAFPASLLSAGDWRQVMGRLDKHYGDDASLDDKTRQAIEAYLVSHAGSVKGTPAEPGGLPRLTASTWFTRTHHEVSRADWRHAKVKSPANCGACHTRAAEGSYREREIVMPSGRPWEDD